MMPTIRVSDATWERLKTHARPLEDKAEDVIVRALDALDQKSGLATPEPKAPPKPPATGKKLPQREFRLPLMKTLLELGGSADVSEVRKVMERKMAPLLSEADYQPVSG